MDAQPDPKAKTPPSDAAKAESGRVAERHRAMLDAAAEAAFEVVMALKGQITAARPEPRERDAGEDAVATPSLPELALAFYRANRALQRTVALHAKLVADDRQPEEPKAPPKHEIRVVFVNPDDDSYGKDAIDRFEAARAAAPARKAQIADVVRRQARAALLPGEHSPRDAADIVERYASDARERLDAEDVDALMRRPFSETLAEICRDLSLTPDWRALADEDWARAELESGHVGAPLRNFSSPASGGGGPRCGGGGAPLPSAPAARAGEDRGLSP